jgi:transcriptional regulator
MYLPPHFEESRPELLHQLMHEYALGVLVTLGPDGLVANHLPFEHDPEPSPYGTLRVHVARANSVWRDSSNEVEALVVFQGPQTYVSPAWYPTKSETGHVVPTYNYLVVHAYGPLVVHDDPAWVRSLVGRLTRRYESAREDPWDVADAPADFIETQLRAIVGIEIPITRLLGKWKASQNRPLADRHAVARALEERGDASSLAMAEAIEDSIAT